MARAFTLIELLIVIVVIALLAGLVGGVASGVLGGYADTRAESTVRQLVQHCLNYKNGGRQKRVFPAANPEKNLLRTRDETAPGNLDCVELSGIDLGGIIIEQIDSAGILVDPWGRPYGYELGTEPPYKVDDWAGDEDRDYCFIYSLGAAGDEESLIYERAD